MKIPFGMYKDREISDLPTDYLAWLSDNYNGPLKNGVFDELTRRKNPTAGITKKYDPMTGANKLIEVILKLPDKFFHESFTLNTLEGKIQVRIERIQDATSTSTH